jgi:general secretion pathway protein G
LLLESEGLRKRTKNLQKIAGNTSGLTLLELMVAIAIIGILAAIAVPNYISYAERARYVVVVSALKEISREADGFFMDMNRYPNDLNEIGMANLKDPWGNSYRYRSVANSNIGQLRKDRSLFPVNSDYDLYSMGRDGKSKLPFTAKDSHDDIVRANNGAYLGYAKDY